MGNITIETVNARLDEAFCLDREEIAPGDYVILALSDDGCGMADEVLGNIFEPFYTTKGVGQGSGMGLATVYGIVKQNNGCIDVTSAPSAGTNFKIYLPRTTDPVAEDEPEPIWETPNGRGQTVLLVEDEQAILKMTTRILEHLGYAVLSAATPGEALRLAEGHSGDIALLMTDVVMPEMNGNELSKRLLSLYPQLKRLFMSGYTADIVAERGLLEQGVHFLQKPFATHELAAKVIEAMEGKGE